MALGKEADRPHANKTLARLPVDQQPCFIEQRVTPRIVPRACERARRLVAKLHRPKRTHVERHVFRQSRGVGHASETAADLRARVVGELNDCVFQERCEAGSRDRDIRTEMHRPTRQTSAYRERHRSSGRRVSQTVVRQRLDDLPDRLGRDLRGLPAGLGQSIAQEVHQVAAATLANQRDRSAARLELFVVHADSHTGGEGVRLTNDDLTQDGRIRRHARDNGSEGSLMVACKKQGQRVRLVERLHHRQRSHERIIGCEIGRSQQRVVRRRPRCSVCVHRLLGISDVDGVELVETWTEPVCGRAGGLDGR